MSPLPTYHELLKRVKQLEEENSALKNELARYRSVANIQKETKYNNTQPVQQPTPQPRIQLSLEEKVALFRSIFKGRDDVFARRWHSAKSGKSGYQPACSNEWRAGLCDKGKTQCSDCANRAFTPLGYDDIYRHLEGRDADGRDVVGIYPVLEDNTCHFLCADFDDKSALKGYKDDVLAFVEVCNDNNIPCSIERSRSGNGAHIWIFFNESIPASKARKMGNAILTEAMRRKGTLSFNSYDRLFPNQDHLPEGGLGNLIALPLQGRARKDGNSLFVDENFKSYSDQWAYLATIKKMTADAVEGVISALHTGDELGAMSKTSEYKPWELPVVPQLSRSDFIHQPLEIVRANMLYMSTADISPKVINHLRRIAAFKNPEFYARQAMRMSTHTSPRIISCSEIVDGYLALPRGCEEALMDVIYQHGIKYTITDKTNIGKQIDVAFNGMLRSDQQQAVDTLTSYRIGVLSAATAFGKSVVAANIIAKRKENTLILVHTKALMDQWVAVLSKFLTINCEAPIEQPRRGRKRIWSPIGCVGGGKDRRSGIIDIAIMQSLLEDDGIKGYVRDYGMVIVDECHHISAFNFEKIMRFANARYVYGLTATPIRKDGHQPIIFMQCGAIRHIATSNTSADYERVLMPRFISTKGVVEENEPYTNIIRRLAEDRTRNEIIVRDAVEVLNAGRTPIILTALTSHVECLCEMLLPYCQNIVRLIGTDSAKQKRLVMDRMRAVPINKKMIIVATGRYVGEGFDFPRLDTLLLALPVSWKGIVAQYAGRLHREYKSKTSCQIYDYIDLATPVCEKMYRKRLKAYKTIGYTAVQNGGDVEKRGYIYDGGDYFDSFINDLSIATREVVVSVPRVSKIANPKVSFALHSILALGVRVRIMTSEDEFDRGLFNLNIDVEHSASCSTYFAVIDGTISWYGDLNFLGYNTSDRTAIRLFDQTIASELLSR
jgi:superfamily II DNA or RNA helicase